MAAAQTPRPVRSQRSAGPGDGSLGSNASGGAGRTTKAAGPARTAVAKVAGRYAPAAGAEASRRQDMRRNRRRDRPTDWDDQEPAGANLQGAADRAGAGA